MNEVVLLFVLEMSMTGKVGILHRFPRTVSYRDFSVSFVMVMPDRSNNGTQLTFGLYVWLIINFYWFPRADILMTLEEKLFIKVSSVFEP